MVFDVNETILKDCMVSQLCICTLEICRLSKQMVKKYLYYFIKLIESNFLGFKDDVYSK